MHKTRADARIIDHSILAGLGASRPSFCLLCTILVVMQHEIRVLRKRLQNSCFSICAGCNLFEDKTVLVIACLLPAIPIKGTEPKISCHHHVRFRLG